MANAAPGSKYHSEKKVPMASRARKDLRHFLRSICFRHRLISHGVSD